MDNQAFYQYLLLYGDISLLHPCNKRLDIKIVHDYDSLDGFIGALNGRISGSKGRC